MNQEWSKLNKQIQSLLRSEQTFPEGIGVLLQLREDLFHQIETIVHTCPAEAFDQMLFPSAKGYHSKTLSYSMWHIFRIEDITAHTLMKADTQVLFSDNWLKRINSPIITTGNELQKEEITEFSKQLNVHALLEYCRNVMKVTDEILKNLEYRDLKHTFGEKDRTRLIDSQCISTDESAFWLIDYWCGKDIRGLIQMPFSRHWIMHVEAMCRIRDKLCQKARKGTDPIAYCGLSCSHCFLKDQCGSCRTSYNTCSFANSSPDGICPNAECCREKGLDGCYECEELDSCTKGFYETGTDGNAVKAMAMFIRKYGKWELPPVLKTLHEKYEFKKIQEVIGYDTKEGLRILEANRRDSDQ